MYQIMTDSRCFNLRIVFLYKMFLIANTCHAIIVANGQSIIITNW